MEPRHEQEADARGFVAGVALDDGVLFHITSEGLLGMRDKYTGTLLWELDLNTQ